MNRTPARLWDFPSAAFLILILLTCSQRLYATHWARGLGTAIFLALIGIVLGIALGISNFKRRAVIWLTFGYSIPIVILVLDWLLYGEISWMERISDLGSRLIYSLVLFFTGRPVQDTVLFVVSMALVFWIIGLMAGFAMTRYGNIIGAVVPAGAALIIVQLYDAGKSSNDSVLVLFFFLCLLLLGRLTYVQRRLLWKEQRVSLLAEARTDLNFSMALVALTTIVLVWSAPTSVKSLSEIKRAWEHLSHPLRTVQENLGHAVAGLQVAGPVQKVEYYGDALALGHQAVIGESTFLRISSPLGSITERYYWRVRSYYIFKNDQWQTENVSRTSFVPDQAPIPLADPEGLTGEFVFTVLSNGLAALVTPARPVWVSTASELVFLQASQGNVDPIQLRFNEPILTGGQYRVRANIYEPTILQLRDAGDTYPDWVTSHYLQLPDDLSPEIVALAQRITAGASTPYDKAAAITDYLRRNITYSETVEKPPAGRDPLAWFLFDSRKGFCNYYATAEVILLRSVGIPARMVVGFAQGEFESPNYYVVRQRDSHAWPEVYFPGVGWMEFEPTTSQASIERSPGDDISSAGQDGTEETLRHSGQSGLETPVPVTGGETGTGFGFHLPVNLLLRLILIYGIIDIFLRMYFLGIFKNVLENFRRFSQKPLHVLLIRSYENRALNPPNWLLHWAYLAELDPIEQSFATVYRSLHWLGKKGHPAQTPAEAAALLAGYLPDVSKEVFSLLHEYQQHLYGKIRGSLPMARRAMKIIRQEALHVAIQQRWKAFGGILKPGHK
jgi:transglutaminase-like putative cysteine protease